MTWYVEVSPIQSEPFGMGLDDNGRPLVGFNIMATKRDSATFLEELIAKLVAQGVGTFGTNIFATEDAQVPAEGGPYLTVVQTGGPAGLRTQNETTRPAYPRPTAQIVARSPKYRDARSMARAAFLALVGVLNAELAP